MLAADLEEINLSCPVGEIREIRLRIQLYWARGLLFWICFIFTLFNLSCCFTLSFVFLEILTLLYLSGQPVYFVTFKQLCVILSNLHINLYCKAFGGYTNIWICCWSGRDSKQASKTRTGKSCSIAAAIPAKDNGRLWAVKEGAVGKSRGVKIIQEMKLQGLSQQGFLPIQMLCVSGTALYQ